MIISIDQPDGRRLAEVKRIGVSGLPGLGSYTLVLNMHLGIFPPESDVYIRDMNVRLDWGDNKQRMLGMAVPEESMPIRISKHHNEKQIFFRCVLSKDQIVAIEKLRNGGDVGFKVWLTAEVTQQGESIAVQQLGEFQVLQQNWLSALERMEYQSTYIYELELPSDNNEPAYSIIKKAQYHLLRGHYEECVGECRKLIEAYPLSDVDQELLKKARVKNKGAKEDRESMDIVERMLVLRDSLNHVTHLAHHHNSCGAYSRNQAGTIFGMTVMLLSASSY